MRPARDAVAVGGALIVLGVGVVLGAQQIPSDATYAGVGPRVFPTLVGAALVVAALVYSVRGWRAAATTEPSAPIYGAILWILAGVALAPLLITVAGFPVVATIAFATTARAFGSRRVLRDVAAGLVVGLVLFLVFARALGISLPGGPLDRL